MLKGIVLKSTGKWYTVELENGEIVTSRLRGKMRLEGLKTTNPIAAGDIVYLGKKDNEGVYVIESIEERKNYIVRKSTNLSKKKQIIAANVDRAYLIVTIKQPETQIGFIDRFLVSAESFRIPVTLLFNKIDLCNDDELEYIDALIDMYQRIAYPGHKISANNQDNIDFLREEIKDKQVVISGHSGVGKSTLINALDPNLNLKTGEISNVHLQGKHTTTFAEMHKLQSGGYIIDTPGIRAFGLIDIDKKVLSHYFPEMRKFLGQCKFNNCLHINEPQCAVKDALENGIIDESRYISYLQMMEEDQEESYRKDIYG